MNWNATTVVYLVRSNVIDPVLGFTATCGIFLIILIVRRIGQIPLQSQTAVTESPNRLSDRQPTGQFDGADWL